MCVNEIKVRSRNVYVKRGDIWLVDIPKLKDEDKVKRSLQKGKRPFLVTSNDPCNIHSRVINGVSLTSSETKATLPTHVEMGLECGLMYNSLALCEAPTSVDKIDLIKKIGEWTEGKRLEIEKALKIQSGLLPPFDINFIEKKKFNIRKSKELYDVSKHEDFYKMYLIALDELKRYCNDYCVDYTRYYDDKNDINILKTAFAV